MKAWTLIVFFLSFNASGYIIANLMGAGILVGHSYTMPYSMTDFSLQFDLYKTFSVLVGGSVIGLIGLMLKQYTFAMLAGLIWILGIFLNMFAWVLYGFPMMLNILLGGTGLEFMAYIVETFVLVFFFFSLAGIMAQRDLT